MAASAKKKQASKKTVSIVEVGLRDGLQNEKNVLSVDDRVQLAQGLLSAGARRMETGAFVSPKWVPQMASSREVLEAVQSWVRQENIKGVELASLVPNEQGMNDALAGGATEVAIFAACSESFSKKNINCSIDESFERFIPVMRLAKKHKIKVRGYLSVCFGCPFEGAVPEKRVVELAERMHKLGVYEISIGDTIGIAHVGQVKSLFTKLKKKIPVKKLAGHFHDTRGQALANIFAAYEVGIRVFDSSIAGLGGCPYAPGASGNVATEDVVYMFSGLGIETGFDLKKLIALNPWVEKTIGHSLSSKVSKAALSQIKNT